MKTSYKYLEFVQSGDAWVCYNKKGTALGAAFYFEDWHQWVFSPTVLVETVHSASCLTDIADFLGQLNGRQSEIPKD